ncbi:response regulator [Pontibacter harenae]|uniref:response regulator n=1 Tax=Pontibacter harenae TaxID=2894083 RepID=UPI001E48234B|nr:response regulator [Pontibacter harenae]MCC9169018.1 response regulator [Pontibacter harenae]
MKIFIIDDDDLNLFLTENLLALEDATHEIKTFLSGTAALEALQTGGEAAVPDIIFLDLNMPVMDGWEFLEALAPLGPSISERCRIYVLTSSLSASDTTRSKEYALVSGLIHKPLKIEDVRELVSQ